MQLSTEFSYVPEIGNNFLQLFPHRRDYLYAPPCRPGDKPKWRTEDRHPLSDRMITSGGWLYGVRFGSHTSYLMLDIDAGSPYHPKRDRLAVRKIAAALEVMGLCEYIAITSSHSGGIHLYFPFAFEVPCWQLAAAVQFTLNQHCFLVEKGLLEIFPNVQPYSGHGEETALLLGHRLPLQAGSYMLTPDWNLETGSSQEYFYQRWRWITQHRNGLQFAVVEARAKAFYKRHRSLSFKAEKFLHDLNVCIEDGWTSFGQTNELLGRITLRAYVFGHVLKRCEPLTGDRLVAEIVSTAMMLPGYRDYCRHQGEIWKRAEEWARCAENSRRYYPYGRRTLKPEPTAEPKPPTHNEKLKRVATERIAFAIADALNRECWPAGITERFTFLVQQHGFSGETLYQPWHLDLWHPEYIGTFSTGNGADGAIGDKPLRASAMRRARRNLAGSLLATTNVRTNETKAYRPFWEGWSFENDRNTLPSKDSSHLEDDSGGDHCGKPRPS